MKTCDRCACEIEEVDEELIEGKYLNFKDGDETYTVVRCDKCFDAFKGLENYKKCEVYSRVCGYIRPVQQWHKGKKEEWDDRVEFKIKSC